MRRGLLITLLLFIPGLFATSFGEATHSSPQTNVAPHWSFRRIQKPIPPEPRDVKWVQTPIDRFILRQLEASGLAPAPPVTRETLIRRVSFDLVGLPPTPEEVDQFLRDRDPNAYENLLDRLLASPHYGERWGRHWLDVARFAESDGFEHDAIRPNAWRYRDYVVRSFNADKPYDQFVREQVAGDELYPDSVDARIATGFNLLGPDMVDSADQIQRRHNTLNDMTDTTALAFLGLTLACARCHDHKFEPLTQRDYYRFQAFFTPAEIRHDAPVATGIERARHEASQRQHERESRPFRDRLNEIEAAPHQKLFEEKLARLSPEAQLAHRTPAAQRTPEQINQSQETSALLKVTEKELLAALSERDRLEHQTLKESIAKLPKPTPLPVAPALRKPKQPGAKTFILMRGDYNRRGDEVQPGFPEILPEVRYSGAPETTPDRSSLAAWFVHGDNPLTARVMVNRIWQHHFGRGLVSTPSEFGLQGRPPTHPELLDWLAQEFRTHGWSIKRLHKLILSSAVYLQSSHASPDTLARDPQNLLFSRRNRLRLEGEAIRDSLLFISGGLNLAMGGSGVFPPIPQDLFKGTSSWMSSDSAEAHQRRSIYIFSRRNFRYPLLEVFDAPDSNLSCPERPRSTSAPQALALLNADEVVAASRAVAARIRHSAQSDAAAIEQACRIILGRSPSAHELEQATAFLANSPLEELCRALINLNAFLYVD
jgi:hypothetical protein